MAFYLLLQLWVRNSGWAGLGIFLFLFFLLVSCSLSLSCFRMILLTGWVCQFLLLAGLQVPADLFTWWQHLISHRREFPAAQRQAQCISSFEASACATFACIPLQVTFGEKEDHADPWVQGSVINQELLLQSSIVSVCTFYFNF